MVSSRRMLRDLLGAIWLRIPKPLRRWSMRLTQTRFTATAGVVIIDNAGRVLLLKHRFRPGSGWGVPGGFIEAGEQPEDALRRELREEVGLELENVQVLLVRSFIQPLQIEVVYWGRPRGSAEPQSLEVKKASWFSLESLPEGLSADQRQLINRAVESWSKNLD